MPCQHVLQREAPSASMHAYMTRSLPHRSGLFSSMVPKSFRTRKAVTKSRTSVSTELFSTHIPNINWGSLHTRTFRRKQLFVCEYRSAKNGFGAPKIFQGLREMGPWYSKDRVGFVETTTVFQFP